jgi:hypothetical protein
MPLRFKVQFVAIADDGSETTEDVVVLDKDHDSLEQLGLPLTEGKQLLREIQRRVLERQAAAFLAVEQACPTCGQQRSIKDHKVVGLRTLFGKMTPQSVRLRRCCRQPGESALSQPTQRAAVRAKHTRTALPGGALGVAGLLRVDGQGAAGLLAHR